MQDNLKEIIQILWSKQLPFVAYRFPMEEEVYILVQQNPRVQSFDLENIESVKGFVIATFESRKTNKAYLLEPDFIFNQHTELNEIEKLPAINRIEQRKLVNSIWLREVYLDKANSVISDLKNNKLQKLVLSRIIEKKLTKDFKPGQALKVLNEKFIHSFNYVFHLPQIGSWIGASPEIFLKVKKSEVETVSLAGTKPVSNISWALKERREQAIVTDFIRHQLDHLGIINYAISEPETVKAGNVVHLSSKFRIPLKELKNKTAKLILGLHPTPAVCGLPQEEALNYILEIEDHHRKFYTGFLGPWNLHKRSELFVNLRCAEFAGNMIHVFVGGGLTSDSEAELEWEETTHKSETLLSVAENF